MGQFVVAVVGQFLLAVDNALAEVNAALRDVTEEEWESFLDALAAKGHARDGGIKVHLAEWYPIGQ